MAKLGHWIPSLHLERALSLLPSVTSLPVLLAQSLVSYSGTEYITVRITKGVRETGISPARDTGTVFLPSIPVILSKPSGPVFEQTCIWANKSLNGLHVWTLNNQALPCSMGEGGSRRGQGHITESNGLNELLSVHTDFFNSLPLCQKMNTY